MSRTHACARRVNDIGLNDQHLVKSSELRATPRVVGPVEIGARSRGLAEAPFLTRRWVIAFGGAQPLLRDVSFFWAEESVRYQ